MPYLVLPVRVSSQLIGEPVTGVWCATCNLPSAITVDLALLVVPVGAATYECDPLVRTVTAHVCEECATVFELPDSPVLDDNRDG